MKFLKNKDSVHYLNHYSGFYKQQNKSPTNINFNKQPSTTKIKEIRMLAIVWRMFFKFGLRHKNPFQTSAIWKLMITKMLIYQTYQSRSIHCTA